MYNTILTLLSILLLNTGYCQLLDHFIPSEIKHSDEININHRVDELTSSNTSTSISVTYLQEGTPKASVKAAVYDLTPLDFDEKEFKNSLGIEMVDIGLIELHSIPFPILEFDDDGQHKYMTQFSVIMKDHRTFEIQNYFDLQKHSGNTRQLRYIISASDWGAIIEILSYFFHQTSKARIEVSKSSSPLEKVYLDEYDFTGTHGYLVVYAVGQKSQKVNLASEIRQNTTIYTSKDYLINHRGSRQLTINNLPTRKTYQRITITDENETIILDHVIKSEMEIIKPTLVKTYEENNTIDQQVPLKYTDDDVSVFPNVFSDQITIKFNNELKDSGLLKKVAILSQSGEVVEILKTNDNELVIDTSSLYRGMYFIKCINGNSSMTQIITKI